MTDATRLDSTSRTRSSTGGRGSARARLRRTSRLAALCAGLALALPADTAAQAGEGQVGLPIGTPAPSAAVEDLEGDPVDLLDFLGGGPALIEFWAIWCENCEALQPRMDAVQERFGDRMRVVAVAVAVSQSLRRVRRHLEEHDPGYPYLWDADGAAVRAYEAPTTSVVVMLDADGNVAYTGVGPDQDLLGAAERIVEGR